MERFSRGRQDRQGGQDRQGLRATRKRNHHTREDKVILGFALDAEAHGSKTFCESMRPRRHGRSPVSAPSARVRKLSLEASQSATPNLPLPWRSLPGSRRGRALRLAVLAAFWDPHSAGKRL